jgi:DHA1 family multidrug resistance protein-like MFS transporter
LNIFQRVFGFFEGMTKKDMIPWRRNLYILFGVQVFCMAGFSMVFPFLPLYIKTMGVATWGTVEFWSGLVFSAQPITMMFSAPLWGVVADCYGRKLMLVRATLGGAVILALMGFAQSAEQLALLRGIQGLVTGTIPAANALVAATAPREHSGEALGLLQTGSWIGVAIGPLIGGVVGDTFGFRESFWVTAGLLAISGVAVLFWVQEDFKPVSRKKRQSLLNGFRLLLRVPKMFNLYAVTFLQALGRMMFFPMAALFVMELMGGATGVASVTGLMMGAQAVTGSLSAVWLGRLGDRIGHEKVLLGALLTAVLIYLPQVFVTAAWQLVALQAFTGLVNGGMIPSIGALMNMRSPVGNQGATYGLNASITAAGRSVAPMLGAAVAMWFGLRSVFILSALVYALAVLVARHFCRGDFFEREP